MKHDFDNYWINSHRKSYLNPCGHPWAALCLFDSVLVLVLWHVCFKWKCKGRKCIFLIAVDSLLLTPLFALLDCSIVLWWPLLLFILLQISLRSGYSEIHLGWEHSANIGNGIFVSNVEVWMYIAVCAYVAQEYLNFIFYNVMWNTFYVALYVEEYLVLLHTNYGLGKSSIRQIFCFLRRRAKIYHKVYKPRFSGEVHYSEYVGHRGTMGASCVVH